MQSLFRTISPHSRRKGFFILALFLFAAGAGVVFAYSVVHTLPNPDRIKERSVIESTKIYDRTGTVVLYEIHGEEKRTVVPLAEIPDSLKKATLAAEDIHFYQHAGLDWRGIIRAFFIDLMQGAITQGGSTITQQLVKKMLLTDERTVQRKIKEAILAVWIERKYSKDEILELYLNQIPYGSNAYGVAAAAQTFFAKPVSQLTLGEAALLAALPKAPTHYSPYGSHKDELFLRRDWILDRMAEYGLATKEAVMQAKRQLVFAMPRQSILAPHFVMFIREYLDDKYGADFVENGGLKVITSLDWNLQEQAEKIVKEGADKNESLVKAANASLVAIDPKTGEILTMVGSRDYWGKPIPDSCNPGINCRFDPHVNIATRERQPGSAFKPFVYATAFKKGYTPETILFDVPTEFNALCNPDGTPGPQVSDPNSCYHPKDYDDKFRGPVSLRQALAQSLNVPSVKLLYLAGSKDSIETARAMGITTIGDPARYGLTLVLGGAEVNLLEMTSAYGAFANEGILHPYNAVLRIENSHGVVLEEKKDSSLPVLDAEVARTINNILSDNGARVPVFSPHSSLYFPNRQVAAKTGTTQDYRDAWVVGYTPSLVAGVWVGNNDNTPMHQGGLSVMVAGPIWHKFLELALASTTPEEFTPPTPAVPEKPILRGIYRAGTPVKIDKISKKLATDLTPPELIEEDSFGPVESILAFVQKDDPLGAPPANPHDDPQYKNWQAAIDRWLSANVLPFHVLPQEVDDVHTANKRPNISFLLPQKDTKNAENVQEVAVKTSATFPLREVSLFINDELIDSKTAPIISSELHFRLPKPLAPGEYRIKITAYDAVQNTSSVESVILVMR